MRFPNRTRHPSSGRCGFLTAPDFVQKLEYRNPFEFCKDENLFIEVVEKSIL